MKDDSSGMMTCPLTPSPIWEGPSQRVPDIQFYSDASSTGMLAGVGTTEMVHCVPTYHPYLSFCASSSSSGGLNPGSAYSLGLGYYGTGGGLTTGPIMLETGSPNKENRLPPTPESSDHDGGE